MALPPDQDRGPRLLALYWTECSIASIVIALRIFSRVKRTSLGWDDAFMLLTMLIFLALAAIVTVITAKGGSRHFFYLSPEQKASVVKWEWISLPFGVLTAATGKVSVGALLLRLFGPCVIWQRWALYFSMVSMMAVTALSCITIYTQCNPPHALWEHTPDAECWDPAVQSNIGIFVGSWSAVNDLFLALLPITIVSKLNMKRSQKIAICVLLGLGVLTAISGAIKASYLPELNNREDITWGTFDLFAWVSIETFLIIVLGSVPALKPLYDTYMPMLVKDRCLFPNRRHQDKHCPSSYQPIEMPHLADTSHATDIRSVQPPPKAHVRDTNTAGSDIHVKQTFEMSSHRESLRESSENASERTLEAKQETDVSAIV